MTITQPGGFQHRSAFISTNPTKPVRTFRARLTSLGLRSAIYHNPFMESDVARHITEMVTNGGRTLDGIDEKWSPGIVVPASNAPLGLQAGPFTPSRCRRLQLKWGSESIHQP